MAQARRSSNVARYLTISATQGSADAFVQGSVDTGIIPDDGVGFRVLSVEFSITSSLAAVSADASLQWSLSRDTQTSVVGLDNASCILFDGWSNSLTTSGQVLIPAQYRYTLIDGIYIVEPSIYAQMDGTATGVQAAFSMRIYYEEVALSEVDILRILNNS